MSATALDVVPITSILVPVEASFQNCLEAAAIRLGYTRPTLRFRAMPAGMEISGGDLDEVALRRDVLHAVYRERILERTLPMRRSLIDGLMGT